jgi:hypothetical protein
MSRSSLPGVIAVVVAAGCGGGGGGGGGNGGRSIAPVRSGATGPTVSGTTTNPSAPNRGQDYTGVWEVTGLDPAYGSYSGTAVVSSSASGLAVERMVTFAKKLDDGRELVHAWNGTATKSVAGLDVETNLLRADIYKSAGNTRRTAADMQPFALRIALAGPNGAAPTNVVPGTKLQVPSETWAYSNAAAPTFPRHDRKSVALHQVDNTIKQTSFAAYASYHQLPAVAPYAQRPEFLAAQHFVAVDRTAKAFYRARGRTCVLVFDKILDEVSIAEETPRADAFSQKLHEKAARADADVKNIHMLSCGMIAAIETATGARWVSGDGALWQGCYVQSQAYRYLVTKEPEALANVEKAVGALITMVEICPNKTEFARAIDEGTPATLRPNWVQGTGSFANLQWLTGGNNDMLHGLDTGFLAADLVLPSAHPLRARIGAAARSLIDNCSLAQSGMHLIFQSYVCWRMTGDAGVRQRYEDAIGVKSLHLQGWVTLGNGIVQAQGISDWSGHHLGTRTMIDLQHLGGASPGGWEKAWRAAGENGARSAFSNLVFASEGLLAVLAAQHGAPGAKDMAKEILEEVPYPKPTGVTATIDMSIAKDFCMSPYPAAPWKFDWMTNPGRHQGIEGLGPYFRRGTSECYWKDGPLYFGGSVDRLRWVPQDYLHAYWLARWAGLIGPND